MEFVSDYTMSHTHTQSVLFVLFTDTYVSQESCGRRTGAQFVVEVSLLYQTSVFEWWMFCSEYPHRLTCYEHLRRVCGAAQRLRWAWWRARLVTLGSRVRVSLESPLLSSSGKEDFCTCQ